MLQNLAFTIGNLKNAYKNGLSPEEVINEIFAGDNKNFKVLERQTIRVFTGSKMPLGANRVIIQENCKITNKSEITAKINNSDELYIRKKGQDFKKGALILKQKHQINSRDIGLLVTSGIKKVLVFSKSGGNEDLIQSFHGDKNNDK